MNEDCRGELLARVRRGLGSDQDRIALDAHLLRCSSCAMSHEVGEDFRAAGIAAPGDAELVLRLSERVSTHREASTRAQALHQPRLRLVGTSDPGQPPSSAQTSAASALAPRGKKRTIAIALAAAVVASAAAASLALQTHQTSQQTIDLSRAPGHDRSVVSAPGRAGSTITPNDGVPPVAVETAPEKKGPLADVGSTETPKLSAPQVVTPSAKELYRKANDARRRGETSEATRLYQVLQRRHPASTEAILSRVSLGSILLAGGATASALTQYEGYLKTSDVRLRAEALYGQGKALGRLGRTDEELATWRTMLSMYPSSAYATHAQERISALSN